MFLAQSLPDAMTDELCNLREDQRTLDEILDYFSALYKVESDVDLETQLRNIRQHESETAVTFHSKLMKLIRQLQINGLRPPPKLELLQFLPKIRMSHEIRLMRPSTGLQAVEFACEEVQLRTWKAEKGLKSFVQGVSTLSLLSAGTVEMLCTLHKVAGRLETRLLLQEIGKSSEPEAKSVVFLGLLSAKGWLEFFSPWKKFS
jgi:hypothetical protein